MEGREVESCGQAKASRGRAEDETVIKRPRWTETSVHTEIVLRVHTADQSLFTGTKRLHPARRRSAWKRVDVFTGRRRVRPSFKALRSLREEQSC